ncbi:MAG: tRNA pseudouridine(55) synthase TruB [Actinomycetota bacterium]|nr:tRNA pseudouridine(55) synthase TruB [Actinomycetota bacterium]
MSRRRSKGGPTGLAVVDKSAGWTSHDVVAKARGVLGTSRVGHSGTLDPDATGVLLLGVGGATRLLRFLSPLPKTYVGEMVLGTATSTLDASGEVTATWDMSGVTLEDARRVAAGFVGEIEQVPPMVSAVKVGGRRLHELAREGKEVDRAPRPVVIHRLEVSATTEVGVFRLDVTCSSGTYIRTLAADIGTALGGGAHLRDLRRTAIGSFTDAEARPVEEIELLGAVEIFRGRPTVPVAPGGELEEAVRHGRVLAREVLGVAADDPGPWPLVDGSGRLVAVYEHLRGAQVKPAVVLASQRDPEAG